MTKTAHKVEVVKVEIVTQLDENPDLSFLGTFSDVPGKDAIETHGGPRRYKYFHPQNTEYGQQDYERMCAYNRGDWHMVGVFARATLLINIGDRPYAVRQTIRSTGLWGIESDSDPDYIEQEVGCEQYKELLDILAALGIPEDAVPAWEDVERSEI